MAITGLDVLQRALKDAPDLVRVYASSAIGKSTVAVAQRMQALAPVRSGILKSDIIAELPRGNSLRGRVMIQPRAYYWRFLEYGTVKMPARPFVRVSAELEANAFVENMRDAAKSLERNWTSGQLV